MFQLEKCTFSFLDEISMRIEEVAICKCSLNYRRVHEMYLCLFFYFQKKVFRLRQFSKTCFQIFRAQQRRSQMYLCMIFYFQKAGSQHEVVFSKLVFYLFRAQQRCSQKPHKQLESFVAIVFEQKPLIIFVNLSILYVCGGRGNVSVQLKITSVPNFSY